MANTEKQAAMLADTDDLSTLVRVHQCKKVLVRDLGLCLECEACRKACERRHGEGRWQGLWSAAAPLEVAPVCHGCASPRCIESCPRKALSPVSKKPSVTRNVCVGCGLCAHACPFGAISCNANPNSPQKTATGRKGPRKIAVKCDGCSGYRKSACVQECPTGILRFVSWTEFVRLADDSAPSRYQRLPLWFARKCGLFHHRSFK